MSATEQIHEHKWVFLRQETQNGFTKKVDIYFCEKCLEYREVVVWEMPRF